MAINVSRTLSNSAPELGGGVLGVAVPVGLRETVDVRNGQEFSLIGQPGSMEARLTRPSVAWGLGVGGLTGLLYYLGVGPRWMEDFYLAHTLTGIPSGVLSFALPKEVASTASGQSPNRSSFSSGSNPSANGEFSPAGGLSPEMQPSN